MNAQSHGPPAGRRAILSFDDVQVEAMGASDDLVITWGSLRPTPELTRVICLTDEVREHQDDLRSAYLSWLKHVASTAVAGETVERRLAIRSDLSYWWMGLPAQFPFWKDSPVLAIVKFFALDSICNREGIQTIHALGGTSCLREGLVRWCRITHRSVSFGETNNRLAARRSRSVRRSGQFAASYDKGSVRAAAANVNAFVRSVGSIAVALFTGLLNREPYETSQWTISQSGHGPVFVDYVGPREVASLESGRFTSRYWGPLVDLVAAEHESLWLHRRVNGCEPFSATVTTDTGTHIDVTRLPAVAVRLRGAGDLARIAMKSVRIARHPEMFVDPTTGVDAWPLVRRSWAHAFFGANGLAALTWLRSIEADVARIETPREVFFLHEGQPWELSLMSAWRRAELGPTVGFAHTTIRHWDLRYAISAMASSTASDLCPIPDVIAVNGPAARAAAVGLGIPVNRLVDVEAVRYLGEIATPTSIASNSRKPRAQLRVLILGEYESTAVQRQLELVDAVGDEIPPTTFMIRPHPASTYTPPPNTIVVKCSPTTSLTDALTWSDAVVVGETSSVVIEALSTRKPLAIVQDPALLPTNPLDNMAKCPALRAPGDLAAWIRELQADPLSMASTATADDFYFLDPGLRRWKQLLAEQRNMLLALK